MKNTERGSLISLDENLSLPHTIDCWNNNYIFSAIFVAVIKIWLYKTLIFPFFRYIVRLGFNSFLIFGPKTRLNSIATNPRKCTVSHIKLEFEKKTIVRTYSKKAPGRFSEILLKFFVFLSQILIDWRRKPRTVCTNGRKKESEKKERQNIENVFICYFMQSPIDRC